jgi:hypothetical protein
MKRSGGLHSGIRVTTVVIAICFLAARSASADFVPGKDVQLTGPTHDITAGDLNGDRRADLVVTHAHSVEVFKGRGDGTFKRGGTFGVGEYPQEITRADINHDGVEDLATANYRSDDVSVLLGQGDGTFKRRINTRAGNGPTSIEIGRLNGDRRLDLVGTDLWGECVSVLLGKGDGTFRRRRTYRMGETPTSVAMADLNGDRKQDIVAAAWDKLAIRKGRGNGTFKRRMVIPMRLALEEVVSADFNRDGAKDLAVNNIAYNDVQGVHVLTGRGNGEFKGDRHNGFDSAPTKIAASDITGDRRKDLVVGTEGYPLGLGGPVPGYLFVLRAARYGTFTRTATLHLDDQGGRFAIGDFDRDGKRDIAAVVYASTPEIEFFLSY